MKSGSFSALASLGSALGVSLGLTLVACGGTEPGLGGAPSVGGSEAGPGGATAGSAAGGSA